MISPLGGSPCGSGFNSPFVPEQLIIPRIRQNTKFFIQNFFILLICYDSPSFQFPCIYSYLPLREGGSIAGVGAAGVGAMVCAGGAGWAGCAVVGNEGAGMLPGTGAPGVG